MGELSSDLYDMGFTPTGRQSPVDDSGELWSNGHEVVCDETGVVISDTDFKSRSVDRVRECGGQVFRYRNSERVRLPGGYIGSYDWGDDNGEFRY